MSLRDNGSCSGSTCATRRGRLQVAISQKDCSEAGLQAGKLTDLSDIIIVSGRV